MRKDCKANWSSRHAIEHTGQFLVAQRTARVDLGVIPVALDRLGVVVNGGRIVALLEELVSHFLLIQQELRVDLGFALSLLQHLLDLAQFSERVSSVRCSVSEFW